MIDLQNLKAYQLSTSDTLSKLDSQKEGLKQEEAEKRLTEYGLNEITSKKKISALSIYLDQFKNTLILILLGSTLLILFIYYFGDRDPSDLIEAGLILTIVIMITILGFIQEYKAEKSIESLKKLLAFKAKVQRNNTQVEIDIKNLVPGDIVILEEGEKIPADIRLIETFNLSVNESSLTGESNNVTKTIESLTKDLQINDQTNMVFSGTVISSGRGIGIVVKTGNSTEIGKIASSVAETSEEQTPIQKRLDQIGKAIGFVILGICVIVFVFIMFFAKDYQDLPLLQKTTHSFIASVALAVAAIPEGLPAVVTIALAFGTQRMLKKKALVRKLNSIETLGSTDTICTDKTGTLTKGEMTVREIWFAKNLYTISGIGFEKFGKFSLNNQSINPQDLNLILQAGLECNNADISSAKNLGDPTEIALLISAAKAGMNQKGERVQEIPFSSERKMMSVVIKRDDEYLVFSKGAPEVILAKSSKIISESREIIFDKKSKQSILSQAEIMSSKALRNLGFGYKKLSKEEYSKLKDTTGLEDNLIFLGLQGMIDPPRIEVKPLIDQCNKSGIRVIMITGDHLETAKAVAKEIGILGEGITGDEMEKLSEEQFEETVKRINIYARVNPDFKMRIVEALKKDGHIVAMTGDGVNDAPALKKADIGIAMGITGTDVAKESSDMVLMDDQFGTIIKAIEEGRGIFHNIRKFVTYLLTCNIGEVFTVFLAVVIFQELPLTATMLLWINVVTDGLPAVALGLDPAEKNIMHHSPKTFQSQIITKKIWVEMFIFGLLLSIGVLAVYFVNLPEGELEAKGAAFMAIVFFELIQLFLIRSDYKTSIFSNYWLILAIGISFILQVAIIYIPFLSNLFEIKHFDLTDWLYIIGIGLLICIIFKVAEKALDKIMPDNQEAPVTLN